MRLFLASQDFGNHADRLRELVGENRKVLVIFNQRDYETPETRKEVVERKRQLFTENGFEFSELDLRDYFGKKESLAKFIDEYRPGLIAATGGNTYLLKSAYNQSGFAEILAKDLADDKYVYSGHSAGAMAVTPDYNFYARGDFPNQVTEIYGLEPDWEGLKLVEEYIIPHVDTDWHGEISEERIGQLEKAGKPFVALRDSDVYVIDGERKEVLK